MKRTYVYETFATLLFLIMAAALGCAKKEKPVADGGPAIPNVPTIPGQQASPSPTSANQAFVQAVADAEPGEAPYIEAAKPALTAIAKRDWLGFYNQLSSHAKARMNSLQFVQQPAAGQKEPTSEVIDNPDIAQFLNLIAKMEASLGAPTKLQHMSVSETDPVVLSGKGDRFSVMLAIGGMPLEIPADIRKAAIRASFERSFREEDYKALAEELEISVDDAKAGKWPADSEPDAPYLNFKCVFVEEQGQLKVGYFEFMPPSLLD